MGLTGAPVSSPGSRCWLLIPQIKLNRKILYNKSMIAYLDYCGSTSYTNHISNRTTNTTRCSNCGAKIGYCSSPTYFNGGNSQSAYEDLFDKKQPKFGHREIQIPKIINKVGAPPKEVLSWVKDYRQLRINFEWSGRNFKKV